MKSRIFTLAVVVAMALTSALDCVHAFSPDGGMVGQLTPPELLLVQDGGNGIVTAIDPETRSLTINHQEIVGLMPPMEMLLHVNPSALSDGVRQATRSNSGSRTRPTRSETSK